MSNGLQDFFDPGNFFHDTDSDRLAKEQWEWQKEKYDENFQWQKDVYDYQKLLNQAQMDREDNAVFRRTQDLKNSGLSPTLAAGSSASATPVHAGTAPQYDVGVNPRLEAQMFRENLAKDRLGLAVSLLGNIADVSRTKAETELIKAQRDRYVAETPIELRLKSLEQELSEGTIESKIFQETQKATQSQLETYNKVLTNMLDEVKYGRDTLEFVLRSKFGERVESANASKLEKEVQEKTLAVKLLERLNAFEDEIGSPVQAMSPIAKTYVPWNRKFVKDVNSAGSTKEQRFVQRVNEFGSKVKKSVVDFLRRVTGNSFNYSE